MMTWGEIKQWAKDCQLKDNDPVAIDDGGICLEAFHDFDNGEKAELYIEVGGWPTEEEGEEN